MTAGLNFMRKIVFLYTFCKVNFDCLFIYFVSIWKKILYVYYLLYLFESLSTHYTFCYINDLKFEIYSWNFGLELSIHNIKILWAYLRKKWLRFHNNWKKNKCKYIKRCYLIFWKRFIRTYIRHTYTERFILTIFR